MGHGLGRIQLGIRRVQLGEVTIGWLHRDGDHGYFANVVRPDGTTRYDSTLRVPKFPTPEAAERWVVEMHNTPDDPFA